MQIAVTRHPVSLQVVHTFIKRIPHVTNCTTTASRLNKTFFHYKPLFPPRTPLKMTVSPPPSVSDRLRPQTVLPHLPFLNPNKPSTYRVIKLVQLFHSLSFVYVKQKYFCNLIVKKSVSFVLWQPCGNENVYLDVFVTKKSEYLCHVFCACPEEMGSGLNVRPQGGGGAG